MVEALFAHRPATAIWRQPPSWDRRAGHHRLPSRTSLVATPLHEPTRRARLVNHPAVAISPPCSRACFLEALLQLHMDRPIELGHGRNAAGDRLRVHGDRVRADRLIGSSAQLDARRRRGVTDAERAA